MSNPYEPPRAHPSPPKPVALSAEPAKEPTNRVTRACSVAIGFVASSIAAVILVGALGSLYEARTTWFALGAVTAVGLSLLVGGLRSLMGRIDGVYVSAVVSALLLVWIGFAWHRAPTDQQEYIDTETIRWILAVLALPWLLILFLAAIVFVSKRRAR